MAALIASVALVSACGKGSPEQENVSTSRSSLNSESTLQAKALNKAPCYREPSPVQEYQTPAGKLRIACDPQVGWTKTPQAGSPEKDYSPSKLFLNDVLIMENLHIFNADLGKKSDAFEYWVILWGDGGNACESWSLLAVGPSGHQLYEDLHQCSSWEYIKPKLTFAGLTVRDDATAIDPLCEPYLNLIPSRIKVRNAAVSSNFYKFADFNDQDRWLSKVPARFQRSNWMPFGCLINDFDGVVLVHGHSEKGNGFGLYISQSEAFPESKKQ